MRVRFNSKGDSLTSASDDRTARVWKLQSNKDPCDEASAIDEIEKRRSEAVDDRDGEQAQQVEKEVLRWQHYCTLFGHNGRVWDVCEDEVEQLVFSVSEDCTIRVWSPINELESKSINKSNDNNGASKNNGDNNSKALKRKRMNEHCVQLFHGHQGKGIWRLAYDKYSRVLFTAGADASIKIWNIGNCSNNCSFSFVTSFEEPRFDRLQYLHSRQESQAKQQQHQQQEQRDEKRGETSEDRKGYDSKAEWVRCLALEKSGLGLWVATIQGLLYRTSTRGAASCYNKNGPSWHCVWKRSDDVQGTAPLLCLSLCEEACAVNGHVIYVALGDSSGCVTLLKCKLSSAVEGVEAMDVDLSQVQQLQEQHQEVVILWKHIVQAHPLNKRVLDVFWPQDLCPLHFISADRSGVLRVWTLTTRDNALHDTVEGQVTTQLTAELTCPVAMRVLAVSCNKQNNLLVCGNQAGAIFLFHEANMFSNDKKLADTSELLEDTATTQPIYALKQAHNGSSVTSIRFQQATSSCNGMQLSVRSTGRDGYERHYRCIQETDAINANAFTERIKDQDGTKSSSPWSLEVFKQLRSAPITALESIYDISDQNSSNLNKNEERIAFGFHSAQMIVRSLLSNFEIARVDCGGWRRPHTFAVTKVKRTKNSTVEDDGTTTSDLCFSFVYCKDKHIYFMRTYYNSQGGRHNDQAHQSYIVPQWKLPARTMHVSFHGSEVLSSLVLDMSDSRVRVLSGGEDGNMRCTIMQNQQKVLSNNSSLESLFVAKKSFTFGEQPEGCTARAIRHVKAQYYTALFSAGSKYSLVCWIRRNAADEALVTKDDSLAWDAECLCPRGIVTLGLAEEETGSITEQRFMSMQVSSLVSFFSHFTPSM